MRYFRPIHLNHSGDTIVEVLIAVAIISSVLTGAFLVSQKSSAAVRDSQERSEMIQVLQGQVELVRSRTLEATDSAADIYAANPKYFCMNGIDPTHPLRVNSSISGNLPELDADDFGNYNPVCRDIQGRYNVATTYDAGTKVFTFYGRWDAQGGGKDQEKLVYRAYPGKASFGATPAIIAGSIADVGPLSCTTDPLTGLCAVSLVPPSYHWSSSTVNLTNNPGLTVLGCSWLWSDGVKNTDKWCNFKDVSGHVWVPIPGYPPYPAGCPASPNGSVTLTMNLSDGSNPSKVFPLHVPNCY